MTEKDLGNMGEGTRKAFASLSLSHMLVETFLLMHPALVPVFIKEFGLSIFEAGLLISIPSLCRLVIVIPTGMTADRFGSKRLIVLSLTIAGLSSFLVSQSATIIVLILALSMIMISVTLYHPPGLSALSRLFPNASDRSRAVGLHGAAGSAGQSVGTITLGLLLALSGWRFCYLLFSIPLLAWMLIFVRTRIPQFAKQTSETSSESSGHEPPLSRKIGPRRFSMKSGFLMLLSSMGLFALATGGIMAFMTTYISSFEGVSIEMASVIFGVGPLVGVAGALVGGYLSSRFGEKRSLMLIYLTQIGFLLGLIASPNVWLLAMAFFLYQMFLSALWTPATCMVANLTGQQSGGVAYSLYFLSHDALGAVAPLVAALIITGFGIAYPFVFAIVLLSVSGLIVHLIKV